MKLAKPEHPQLDRITIRLDHEKAELLALYAQMLGADTDYVIAGALTFLFKGDKEFEAYRANVRTDAVAIPETLTKNAHAIVMAFNGVNLWHGSKRGRTGRFSHGFQAMMADARNRPLDVVVSWTVERFTRKSSLERLQHLNALTGHGIAYHSFMNPYLDSCGLFKDAIVEILGTIAKQERQRLPERMRAALERVKAYDSGTGNAIGSPKVIFDCDRVVESRRKSHLWSEISRRIGVDMATVCRACQAATGTPVSCQDPIREGL